MVLTTLIELCRLFFQENCAQHIRQRKSRVNLIVYVAVQPTDGHTTQIIESFKLTRVKLVRIDWEYSGLRILFGDCDSRKFSIEKSF